MFLITCEFKHVVETYSNAEMLIWNRVKKNIRTRKSVYEVNVTSCDICVVLAAINVAWSFLSLYMTLLSTPGNTMVFAHWKIILFLYCVPLLFYCWTARFLKQTSMHASLQTQIHDSCPNKGVLQNIKYFIHHPLTNSRRLEADRKQETKAVILYINITYLLLDGAVTQWS